MFYKARQRAKEYEIPFTIKMDDIIVPEFCPVLGTRLTMNWGKTGPGEYSPTLDRFDPDSGYTPENICVISFLANRIKSNGTPAQVQAVADWMLTQAKGN
jgi:hypothetical protein